MATEITGVDDAPENEKSKKPSDFMKKVPAGAKIKFVDAAPTPVDVQPMAVPTTKKGAAVVDALEKATGQKLAAGKPVALTDATEMYQRVRGTGKVYRVVAIIEWHEGNRIVIAARASDQSMSGLAIRAAGSLWGTGSEDVALALKAMGLAKKSGADGDHVSLHLSPSGAHEARRALGAFIVALTPAGARATPLPDVTRLIIDEAVS